MRSYLLQRALLPTGPADDVLVEIRGGRFGAVTPGATAALPGQAATATRVGGLSIPGIANTHSHAFHRALRGRTQRERGSFWTWREQMYAVAARLDPDSMFALGRATYAEMAAAGITSVGEFHYLHHQPDGKPYAQPNAMGDALIAAAREVGIRIALLDTCYLSAGFGRTPEGVQRRFSDGDATAWAARAGARSAAEGVVAGAAIHSVRAVPADQMGVVVAAAQGAPLHVHLSEQPAENQQCLEIHGLTPTALLNEHGALGPRTTAVHATHLTDADIALLGQAGCYAGFCPTTERDLGDGIGPGRRLRLAGAWLTLGSDSHAVIDPFEELRALETHERLATLERGHWAAEELLQAATAVGQRSLGFADAGRIEPGARADLVALDLESMRLAGTGADAAAVAFAATAADVTWVMADGRVIATGDAAAETGRRLGQVIDRLWAE